MPRGNVELARNAVESWRRRDIGAVRSLFHEDAEFRSAIVGGVEGGVYRGHGDIERYFADMADAFEDWHTEDERFIDVGGDQVVLVYRIIGKAKGSDVPIDRRIGFLFTLRGAKVVLGEAYLDPQEALKVGLQHAVDRFSGGEVDAAVDNLDPDIEWEHLLGSGAPEEGVYHGRDQVRSLLERLREGWGDVRVDLREIVEAAEDSYVMQAVMHAKGRTSDIEVDSACEYVLELRDGKVVRLRFALTGPAPRGGVGEPSDSPQKSETG